MDDNCWEIFLTNPKSLNRFFKDLLESTVMISDKIELITNRNVQNQSLVTDLKLNQSHFVDDKEKLVKEKEETLKNLE